MRSKLLFLVFTLWFSTIAMVQAQDTKPPTMPTGLMVNNLTVNSFSLSWTASMDSVGVVGYDVFKDGSFFISSPTSGGVVIAGLSPNTNYNITVKAKDAAGNFSPMASIPVKTLSGGGIFGCMNPTATNYNPSATTNDGSCVFAGGGDTQAPTAPTNLNFSDLTANSLMLHWTASTDNVGVVGYDIFKDGLKLGSTTGNTNFAISGLISITSYNISVKAKDAAGNISNLASIQVMTPQVITGIPGCMNTAATNYNSSATTDDGSCTYPNNGDAIAPTVPTNLNASNITGNGFTLNWTPSIDNVGVIGYEVRKDGVYLMTVSTAASLPISGLMPNTLYNISVRAKDAVGNTSLTAVIPVTTGNDVSGILGCMNPMATNYNSLATVGDGTCIFATVTDTIKPSIPTALNFSNLSSNSFMLNWMPSTDNVGVVGYEIMKNGAELASSIPGTNFTVFNLLPNTTYIINVKAKDAAGNRSVMASLTVTTPGAARDSIAPSVPNGLLTPSISLNGILLTWAPSTDNVGVNGYEVYKDGQLCGSTTGNANFGLTGLMPNTNYTLTVKAKDAAGNLSLASASITVTTLAAGTGIGGCTDNKATNYSSAATYNNGTCTYAVVRDSIAPTSPVNLNFNNLTSNGFMLNWMPATDNIAVVGYDVFRDNVKCNSTMGGTNVNVMGLLANMTYSITVIAKDASGNMSAPAMITVKTPATGASVAGCTDYKAKNYNSLATYNNGTCQYDSAQIVWGCMNPTASNYNVYANKENGTCTFSGTQDTQAPSTPQGLYVNNIMVNSFMFGWAPSGDNVGVAGYEVYKDSVFCGSTAAGNNLQISGLIPNTMYRMTVKSKDAAGNMSTLSTILTVRTMSNSTGMGIPGCNDPKARNFDVNATFNNGTCIFDAGAITGIPGCMDKNAKNYNSLATFNNGACLFDSAQIIWGCMNQTSLNYNPMANRENGTCTFGTGANQPIYGCINPTAKNFNPTANTENGSCVFDKTTAQVPGCNDPKATNYYSLATTNNGTCTYPTAMIVMGCMNPTASNYNPLANKPDGACVFNDTTTVFVFGCSDPKALNYNSKVNRENGTCKYDATNILFGCMNPTAKNFNVYANKENGSCIFNDSIVIFGCTDPVASNYNHSANRNNNTCQYNAAQMVFGCMNSTAMNFNPIANKENGTCQFAANLIVYGCMNPSATNFNANANKENGSCVMNNSAQVVPGCMNKMGKNYNPYATREDGTCIFVTASQAVAGCLNPKAKNFDRFATTDNGSCVFNDSTIRVFGCINPTAKNYNPLANVENGSCIFGEVGQTVWGCMKATAANFNPLAQKDNGTCVYGDTALIVFGCRNVNAKNYNALATKENGTCVFTTATDVWGCINRMAKNYNPAANKENGTCIFGDSVRIIWGCTNSLAKNFNPMATQENGSCFFGDAAGTIFGCMKPGATNYNAAANKENGSCIFTNASMVVIPGCINPMARNFNKLANKEDGSCLFNDSSKMVLGCTNPMAKNFNRMASQENGTCVFGDLANVIFGCTKVVAKNYNPIATKDNGSCVFEDVIKLPVYGCTDKKATNFNILAVVNNGSCLYDTLALVMGCNDKRASNFNPLAKVNNGTCTYVEAAVVYGCMDSLANNFNRYAKHDNSNCVYETFIPGCMDPLAKNFNHYANLKDGSCKYEVKVWGCTDSMATNFNRLATHNNGMCTYPTVLRGCTDKTAVNYDPAATKDNKTCLYTQLVSLGCMNRFALNYNPYANTENGSCVFETVTNDIVGCKDKTSLNYNPLATTNSGCLYAASYSGVIRGCTSPMGLNYNKNATQDNDSCIYANPANLVTTVLSPEITTVADTVANIVEGSCAFDFSTPIDTVYIIGSTTLSVTQVEIEWGIKQGSKVTSIKSTYTVGSEGTALLYLSLVCNSDATPQLVNGQRVKSETTVNGVTVDSYYRVESVSTRLASMQKAEDGVRFFPVPAKDRLNVAFICDNDDAIQLNVCSVDGAKITTTNATATVGSNLLQINTSELRAGLYILTMSKNGVVFSTRKFTKQ